MNWSLSFQSFLRRCFFLGVVFLTATGFIFSQEKDTSDIKANLTQRDDALNTGYIQQRNYEITGSVFKVRAQEFSKGYITDPAGLIVGKVPGLSISKPGGDPNGSYYMRLRGLNTIGENTQPLIVIDGSIGASLYSVDPNDIESITVLKDASLSAIYGMRGSNGVILITTRNGKAGNSEISYNTYATAEFVAKNNPAMTASEWRELSSLTGRGTDYGSNTDWFKEIEQTALSTVHNIAMSGGTDLTTYRASINYQGVNGVLINTGYDQLNGRFRITQKALKDKLTLDLNMGATERKSEYGFPEAVKYASIFNPTAPVRSSDPAYAKYDGYFQQTIFDYYNPVAILELDKNEGKNNIIDLSLKGSFQISRQLSIDAFYSMQSIGITNNKYFDKNDFWNYRNGLASKSKDNLSYRLLETTFRYNTEISSTINLGVSGGYSYQDFTNEGFSAEGGNFLTDNFTYNNLGAAQDFKDGNGKILSYKDYSRLSAFFGQANLNLSEKIFVNASARYEGSSRNGLNQKWALFPAIGGGVFIIKSGGNNLKLRMSYGITGNQPAEAYRSLPLMGPTYNAYYNGKFIPSYQIINYANPDLKNEKKKEFNTGIDFSLAKSGINASLDIYTATATNLLYQVYSPISNYAENICLNMGEIKSSGMEFSISFSPVRKPEFTYNIAFAGSLPFKNKLVTLSTTYKGVSLQYGKREIAYPGGPGGSGPGLVQVEEGKPLGQLFGYVFKEIDQTGTVVLEDFNENGYIDYYDGRVIGNGLPKYLLGIDNSFSYKKWDINVFFRCVLGHDILNSYRATYEAPALIDSYNLPASVLDLANGMNSNMQYIRVSSYHVENGSFISLDNMSLGYSFSLPKQSSFKKLRIYLAANNLFYLTAYKGSDPNPRYFDPQNLGTYNDPFVIGIDRMITWPRTRSVTFGLNVLL